jgi:hypothetical protein
VPTPYCDAIVAIVNGLGVGFEPDPAHIRPLIEMLPESQRCFPPSGAAAAATTVAAAPAAAEEPPPPPPQRRRRRRLRVAGVGCGECSRPLLAACHLPRMTMAIESARLICMETQTGGAAAVVANTTAPPPLQ